ncbi:MAG: preprotein translocase subunit SecE [Paludibacteraceae bacterium]|nr:preprotein translocase subunit SecE [Paludibacteraceae bacterium]
MDAVINYIKESYNELVYKVSWTKRSELVSHAVVVLIASLLIALVIFLVDKFFEEFMKLVYGMLS